MNRRITSITFAGLSLAVAFASCGGSGGSSPASPTNTAPAVISTPYPPGPTPTATPTPFPAPQTLGNVACTAADNAVPGGYMTIAATGGVVGSTLTGNGSYFAAYYVAAATPAPSPTPIPIPTGAPGAANLTWIAYYGEYVFPIVPSFTTAPTMGCFELVTEQQLGQTVGESQSRHPLPQASASTPPFAYAMLEGAPAFASPLPGVGYVTGALIGSGQLPSFSISNLTRTTGSGTFTTDFGGTGTVTITGSTLSIGANVPAAIR